MADWTYQIIDQSGKERKGNIVAESEAEAKNKLKMDGNMVISLTKATALTVLVLMQEGKSAGLGSISGAAETYWGRNKGRSMEGMLVKITKILAVFFMLLAVVLNLNVF